jgi:hypothetical protein
VATQARRATGNSPAIDRWGTGVKHKTSPVRDERGQSADGGYTLPPHSDRTHDLLPTGKLETDGRASRASDLSSLCNFTRRRTGQEFLTTPLIRPTGRVKMVAISDGDPDGANA